MRTHGGPILRDLGQIRGGHVATSDPADRSTPGAWRALQAGDLQPDGSVEWSRLRWVTIRSGSTPSEIREEDVLVPLRSTRVAALVARGVPDRTIGVGHWAVITTGPDLIPDYLAWYLGHPTTARALAGMVVGTKLSFLPLSAVRDLEVEVPPLAVQERIVRVQNLHATISRLETQLATRRSQYLDALTRAALDGAAITNR